MSQLEFSQTFPFVISNSFASIQNIPEVDIKNPLDAVNYVNAVEIIPDPAFQLKGMIIVTVNDLTVFTSPQVGFFKSYSRFSIPVTARQLSRQGHVKIFAWNGTGDGSPISASGTMIISDKNFNASSGSISSDSPRGSDTVIIFPYILRAIGTYTQQVDLAGYKKLLILIAAAAYIRPIETVISSPSGGTIGNGNANDANLATFENWGNPSPVVPAGTQDNIVIYDFSSIDIRTISIKFQAFGSSQVIFSVSTDGLAYTQIYNHTGATALQTFTDISRNVRYVKIEVLNNANSIDGISLYEVYDSSKFGGQAEVSFEALEPSSNQWIEIVSSALIGTISQGQAISKQLGDTMALTNLNVIFASNYAGLRMKLTILNGNIQTAVSVQRLA